MLAMPGSHEPFTKDMLKAIDDIDPDSMEAGMRRELSVIEKQHPGTKGKLDRTAIESSARAARFLKIGAAMKPALSPADDPGCARPVRRGATRSRPVGR